MGGSLVFDIGEVSGVGLNRVSGVSGVIGGQVFKLIQKIGMTQSIKASK
jgi:hypothetical protein